MDMHVCDVDRDGGVWIPKGAAKSYDGVKARRAAHEAACPPALCPSPSPCMPPLPWPARRRAPMAGSPRQVPRSAHRRPMRACLSPRSAPPAARDAWRRRLCDPSGLAHSETAQAVRVRIPVRVAVAVMHQSLGNASDPKTPPSGASAKLPPLTFHHAKIALVHVTESRVPMHQESCSDKPIRCAEIVVEGVLRGVND